MGKRVLIIDNDHDVLDVIQEALSYEGYDTVTLIDSDGYEQTLAKEQFDIVIIDYLLEGINGGDICHQIKSADASKHIPVIIMSAYPKVLQSLGDYGCDKFMPKPFDLTELIDVTNQLVNSRSGKHTEALHEPE
ncbi:response regulator [Mucilaginibacter achroorhodeus]|uniref:Response regulator n=1 Tax=Mucilaginibacter achroorhodeus TaxID=2599294 RepID=A0A563U2N7_9SPHI|nr:response regulator [Mucilaginibacter achroorhodeus]TWR25605.1 response regulator [Mucilaginibacter achroorhodeus]